jgi:hypothetical protein
MSARTAEKAPLRGEPDYEIAALTIRDAYNIARSPLILARAAGGQPSATARAAYLAHRRWLRLLAQCAVGLLLVLVVLEVPGWCVRAHGVRRASFAKRWRRRQRGGRGGERSKRDA